MRTAFTKIFWGYLMTLIEFRIEFIDMFPEPIGYFLIFSGVRSLSENHSAGGKSSNWALALIVITMPTVFIPLPTNNAANISDVWEMYYLALPLLQLILVFYLFQLMQQIAEKGNDQSLQGRTRKLFRMYIVWMLTTQIYGAFLFGSVGQTIMLFLILGSLLMEVLFLMLIWRVRKIELEIPPDQWSA